jgi:CheY-like chemotaxis protein
MSTPSTSLGQTTTGERARVLVVDDDPVYRNLLVALLRRNYEVSVAEDGLSGLQKAKESPPDIAVIDIQMPGLDGLQTVTAIRRESTLSRTRMIMLTADASRDTVLAAVQAGAHDYCIKTAFSRDEFVRKIERMLQWTPIPANGNAGGAQSGSSAAAPHSNHSERPSQTTTAESTMVVTEHLEKADLQEILDAWE